MGENIFIRKSRRVCVCVCVCARARICVRVEKETDRDKGQIFTFLTNWSNYYMLGIVLDTGDTKAKSAY